jgi:DNA repair exonuclease SbcCD ATPase subunit
MAVIVNIKLESDLSGITPAIDAVKKLEAQTKSAFQGTSQATASMATGLQQLAQQVTRNVVEQGNLSKAFLQTGQAAQTSLNQFERMRQQFQQTDQASQRFSGALSTVRTALGALGVTLGIAGLVQWGRSVVDAGVQLQKWERALQSATGSADGAKAALAFITVESNRLGQSIASMVPSFAQLAAATRGTTLEGEKTRALFSALAGAGTAVGLSTEATGRAMVGLIQIISQNSIQLDEFRNQFASQIPGAMRETARALKDMGVTTTGSIAEMLSLIDKQKLSITDLMEAVTRGLQTVQRDAPDMANSAEAAFQRFSNAILKLKQDLASSGILEFMTNMAETARGLIASLGQGLNLVKPDELVRLRDLQEQLSELRKAQALTREEGGFDPEATAKTVERQQQEIALIEQKITALGDERKARLATAAEAERSTAARNKAEQDELRAIDAQRKAREAAIQAAPGILKAKSALEEAQRKGDLDAIKQFYDQQRQMADQNAQQELQLGQRTAKAIMDQREQDQRQITLQEGQALLAARESQAKQELAGQQKFLQAEIAAAGENQQKLLELRAQEPLAVAKYQETIAQIRAEQSALETKFSDQTTDTILKNRQKEQDEWRKMLDAQEQDRQKQQTDIINQTERLQEKLADLDQREFERQERQYEAFTDRLASSIEPIFESILNGTLDLLDTFKNLFIKTLSSILADVATREFLAPVLGSLVGGVAGILSPSLGGAVLRTTGLAGGFGGEGQAGGGFDLLQTGGLALTLSNLFGPTGAIGGAMSSFVHMLDTGAAAVGNTIADFSTTVAETFGGPGAQGITTLPASGLTALGGLAGIGGGIFSALQAKGPGGQAGGAIGATGGALALATGLGLGLAPIFGPIGLALAAIAPLLGNLIDQIGAPAGPRFTVGRLGGLGIGGGPGGLEVTGAATTRVGRAERLPSGVDTGAIQQQIAASVTNLVSGLVEAINKVAVRPEELLGPARQALDDALKNAITINSSSAKNFQRDIEEQTKFLAVQVASYFLDPLNRAAEQLLSAPLQQQIDRFTPTVAGMADVFKTMSSRIEELSRAGNTDVLRALSAVRNRVENFQNQLVEVAGQLATSIVDGVTKAGEQATDKLLTQSLQVQALNVPGVFAQRLQAATALRTGQEALGAAGLDFSAIQQQLERLFTSVITDAFRVIDNALAKGPFDEALKVILAVPDAVVQLNPMLATFKALAQAFAPVENALLAKIQDIQKAMTPLGQRIAQGQTHIADLAKAIDDAGTNVQVALPLYDQLSQAVVDNANLQIQRIQEIAQAWESAMSQIEGAIASFESSLGMLGAQLARAGSTFQQSFQAFQTAAVGGDTVKAINAAKDYEAALVDLANLQIKQIQANRQATIDAQQDVIAGIQDQIEAQQEYLSSFDDQIKAQQRYIDAIDDQIKVQQKVIDAIDDQIKAQQKAIDATQDAIKAQQEYVSGLDKQAKAQQDVVDGLQKQIDALTGLREQVAGIVRGGQAPVRQAAAIRTEIGTTREALAGATGDEAINQLRKLVDLNQELKQLGEQTNQLGLVKEALDNLALLQQQLDQSLGGLGEQKSIAQQQLDAANAAVEAANAQLQVLQAQLQGQQDQLQALNDQKEAVQEVIDGLNDEKEAVQEVIDGINDQKAIAQDQLDGLNKQLSTAQKQLAAIEKSTYWDEQIAEVQTRALASLYELRDWLRAIQAGQTWEQQILGVQHATLGQLQGMQNSLAALYSAAAYSTNLQAAQTNLQAQTNEFLRVISQYNLKLPIPMHVVNFYDAPRQQGGVVGYASGLYYQQGGLVPVRVEPGESWWIGATPQQDRALAAVNMAFPRFAQGGVVPGTGTGDVVRMWLPEGSRVVNRNATRALGLQQGGTVEGSATTGRVPPVVVNVDLRGAQVRTEADFLRMKAEFRAAVVEALREIERRNLRRGN